MRNLRHAPAFAAVALLGLLLTACGQKGPLYLPEPAAPTPASAPASTAPADAKADEDKDDEDGATPPAR